MQRGSRGTQRGGPCGRRGNRHQETQVSVAGAAIAAGSLPRQNQKAPYGHPQSASKAALPQNCLNCTQNCPPVREICKYVSGEEPANKRGGRLLPNETADWRLAARIRDRCARNGGAVARLCQAAARVPWAFDFGHWLAKPDRTTHNDSVGTPYVIDMPPV